MGSSIGFGCLMAALSVQGLIDLVNREAMKFYIGGGWLSWHHSEVVGQDRVKAREYYFVPFT